nr:uncharacterized protein LOC115259797 [Aedes albopictus]
MICYKGNCEPRPSHSSRRLRTMLPGLLAAVGLVLLQILPTAEATFDLMFVFKIAWDFFLRVMGEFSIGNGVNATAMQRAERIESNKYGKALVDVVLTDDTDQDHSPLSAYLKLMLILKNE